MNRFLKKLNKLDRIKLFKGFILILIALLIFQLFRITIIQGKKYRRLADSRRVKEIMITAQRGNIRDRNGIVLAGNRPVFTVQLRKDEIEKIDQKEKNENFLKLARYLEEDGVHYLDSYPINLNTFVYKEKRDIKQKRAPIDIVIEKLSEPVVLNKFLSTEYQKEYRQHFNYILKSDVLQELGFNKEETPIRLDRKNNEVTFVYDDETRALEFKKINDLDEKTSAQEDIVTLLQRNPLTLKQVLNHPIARKISYDILSKEGLIPNISLRKVGNEYFDKFVEQKKFLIELSPEISWDSSAQSDFYILLKKYSLVNLLEKGKEKDQEKSSLELAIETLKEEKKISDVVIKKIGKKNIALTKEGKDATEEVYKALSEENVLESFLSKEDIRVRAQKQLIADGINSGISVGEGEYIFTQLKNAKDLFARYSVDPKEGSLALFEKICKSNDIDPELSIYEKRCIMNIYDAVNKQGNYAYIPVNYAYEISDKTVAQIEENLPVNEGIDISIEPIRSYPLEKSTSHVLGYIGNIAMDSEIKKYVDEMGYDRNTLIGKTGVEDIFEEKLKGKNGHRLVAVDSVGNTTEVIEEKKPVPGKDVHLTIDIDIQQKAESILENGLADIRKGGTYNSPWGNYSYVGSQTKGKPYSNATSGAIVVLDVKNGDVLAMANYPQFDPNLFAKGINPTDWDSLKPKEEKNPLAPRPLYNVATQTAIQPGSTFKMITGLAGLEKGLDPNLTIQDGGFVDVGGHRFGCWLWNMNGQVHGAETLAYALRDSCNYYFYTLALGKDQKTDKDVGVKLGVEEISDMARRFGLGEKTGLEIRIPQESKGSRPDPNSKRKLLKSLLSKNLETNFENYYTGKSPLTEEKKIKIKNKILATLDREEELTRQDVYEFLQDLDLNPEAYSKKDKMQLVDVLKYTYIDQARWKLADTMNVTIGQGSHSYTPVQLARYAMALGNGGNLYDLHLVDKVVDPLTKRVIQETKVKDNPINLSDPKFYNEIREGMKLVSQTGLNESLFKDFPVEVAMKTGTAERSGENPYTGETYDSFAWEVAYAPADQPEIAVCVVLFQGGSGSNAGPMLQTVLAEYFGLNKEYKEEKLPIETSLEF